MVNNSNALWRLVEPKTGRSWLLIKKTIANYVPTKLKAAVSNDSASITLSWSPAKGATAYNIYRSDSTEGTYTKIKTTSYEYNDTDLDYGKIYYYKYSALCYDVESKMSSAVEARTLTQEEIAKIAADKKAKTEQWIRDYRLQEEKRKKRAKSNETLACLFGFGGLLVILGTILIFNVVP
jgi:fibronectin type 3 domain-containing protein